MLACKAEPADLDERPALFDLCVVKKRHVAAVKLFANALAAEPGLADQLHGPRYNAACAAALAGCGRGADAGQLDEQEYAHLRRRALDWLRADLGGLTKALKAVPQQARPKVTQVLRHWQADPDFAGVRGAEALARLSAAERREWQRLWADVAALLEPPPESGGRELLGRPREVP